MRKFNQRRSLCVGYRKNFNIYCTASSKSLAKILDDLYFIHKRAHPENNFHHIKNLYQSIQFIMEEGSTGELMFLNTLLEQNNGKRSLGILTNAYAIALTKTQVVRKMLFPPCSIEDLLSSQITIIINKEY